MSRIPSVTRRADSSVALFRVKVLVDVRDRLRGKYAFVDLPASRDDEPVTVTAKLGEHIKFSLGTRDPVIAKARDVAALAHLARVFDAARQGPQPMSHANLVALSREVYDFYVNTFADEPGKPGSWSAMKAFNRAIIEGRVAVPPALRPNPKTSKEVAVARELFGFDLTAGVDAHPAADPTDAALECRFGLLASWLLMKRAVLTLPEDQRRLLRQVHAASTDAFRALKRMAQGDYSPNPAAARFPVYKPAGSPAVTLWTLFDAWAAERDPMQSTRSGCRTALNEFTAFLGHDDAARLTPQNVVAWKDRMLADGLLSERTIADVKLAAVKSILALAAKNHRIPANPAQGVTVSRKPKPGDRMRGHREDDTRLILEAALRQKRPVLKWVPWIMPMTGARVGEACAIRKEDVRREGGVWVVDFSSKTVAGERTVPIHASLIDRSFLDFVRSRGPGYLFFDGRRIRTGATAKPGKSAANDVREFIHDLGLQVGQEHRIAHGFRHLFTTMARKVGMDSEKREAMLGHELGGERGTYGAMAGLAAEIAKLPDPLGSASHHKV